MYCDFHSIAPQSLMNHSFIKKGLKPYLLGKPAISVRFVVVLIGLTIGWDFCGKIVNNAIQYSNFSNFYSTTSPTKVNTEKVVFLSYFFGADCTKKVLDAGKGGLVFLVLRF
jgi:hypothetical protein